MKFSISNSPYAGLWPPLPDGAEWDDGEYLAEFNSLEDFIKWADACARERRFVEIHGTDAGVVRVYIPADNED